MPQHGQYIRTQSFGQPGPYFINFKGKNIKPVLANEVKKRGVKVLNRINVTRLLMNGKKAVGAVGFNVRNGNFCIVRVEGHPPGHRRCGSPLAECFRASLQHLAKPLQQRCRPCHGLPGRGNPCQHGTDRQHACPQGVQRGRVECLHGHGRHPCEFPGGAVHAEVPSHG